MTRRIWGLGAGLGLSALAGMSMVGESAVERSGTAQAETVGAPLTFAESARPRTDAPITGGPVALSREEAAPFGITPIPLAPAVPQGYFDEVPYDGIYTFIRVQYGSGGGLRGFSRRGGGPSWSHDTPRAEVNFAKLLNELTFVAPHMEREAARYLTMDDPELFQYPIIHLIEAGRFYPGEEEIEGLRNYLLKGGFMVLDDLRGNDVLNFNSQMQRAIPGALLLPVPDNHRIFDSFFRIEDPLALTPPYDSYPPVYRAYYEDNDPTKRIMVMINDNNDHMEYWEFSDQGYYPIDLANDAYKFGINYIIYGMTY